MQLILFLTYLFPPLGGGGVQRSAKFAKYLPENGWQPIVVVVKPNRRNSIEQGIDQSLIKDLERKNIEIIRCRGIELSSLYYCLYRLRLRKMLFEFERLIPCLHMDYKIGWYWPARQEAKKIISEKPVKLIYSSSTPYSCHLVARELQKAYKLPWVADFRDPWTQIGTYSPLTKLHEYVDVKLEHMVVKNADAVIANTDTNRLNLLAKYELDAKKVYVIPNGFDPEDFACVQDVQNTTSTFIISCVGKFHPVSDPIPFFHAYRRFSDRHPNTLLRFFAGLARPIRRAASSLLREGSWDASDRVEHNVAVQLMRESSVLLANLSGENCEHWVPGKLYEYLAAKRPILFIGPKKGDAADIIAANNAGKVVGSDEQAIFQALEDFYMLWRNDYRDWRPEAMAITRYDRRVQTRRLAEIFNSLVGSFI